MSDSLRLKAGTSAVVEVPFTANPQPTVTWTYNEGKLPDAKRTKDETIIGMTSLTLAKVVRGDTGDYTVTLENDSGSNTITVKVTVVGT